MTTATAPLARAASLPDLERRVRDGEFGPALEDLWIAVAFTTTQAVRHEGRAGGYRNEVLSLRLGEAVGSCAVEPGTLPAGTVEECAGAAFVAYGLGGGEG
ncbi:hypothetical protein CK936_27690, partial [Streptomyces albireticuli]